MRKILTLITFAYISILSFGQERPKDNLPYESIAYWVNHTKDVIGYGINPYDFIQIEDYTFYANPENGTITIYYKLTGDKEVYPLDKIPAKYFYFKEVYGDKLRYDCTEFLPCIHDNKYGCVDRKGRIVMDFIWPDNKVYVSVSSHTAGCVKTKYTNEYVCNFKLDYANGVIDYQLIYKKNEQIVKNVGIEYKQNKVVNW